MKNKNKLFASLSLSSLLLFSTLTSCNTRQVNSSSTNSTVNPSTPDTPDDPVNPPDVNDDVFEYTYRVASYGTGYYITKILDDNLTDIVVPDAYNGIPVVGIDAIKDNDKIKSVHIGANVTHENVYYKQDVMKNLPSLEKITVSEYNTMLKVINNCLISGSNLIIVGCNSSIIPDNIPSLQIGVGAFRGTSLKKIHIPKNVTSIGRHVNSPAAAFIGNNQLIEITSDSVDYPAIDNCLIHLPTKTMITGTIRGNIPEDSRVTTLGTDAFASLNIKSVYIPSNITSFQDSQGSVTGPFARSTVENITFASNSKITQLYKYAFENCNNLKTLRLPDTLTILPNLRSLPSLESFYIPRDLNKDTFRTSSGFADKGFMNTTQLKSLIVAPDCKNFVFENGNLLEKGNNYLVLSMNEICIIPDKVVNIVGYAFSTKVTKKVIVPSSRTLNLTFNASWGMYSEISEIVTNSSMITQLPVQGMNLDYFSIPSHLTSYINVSDNTNFNYAHIKELHIPSTIGSPSNYNVFKTAQIDNIIFDGANNTPYTFKDGCLLNKAGSTLNTITSDFESFKIPSTVASISYQTFTPYRTYYSDITSNPNPKLKISNVIDTLDLSKTNITSISASTFGITNWLNNSSYLTDSNCYLTINNLILPDKLETLSTEFYSCCKINNVSISSSNANFKVVDGNLLSKDGTTLYIGGSDFNIPDSVTTIANSAFFQKQAPDSKKDLVLPKNVNKIGNAAFLNCGLTSVYIPTTSGGVSTSFGSYYVFAYNKDLKFVRLPSNQINCSANSSTSVFYYCNDKILFKFDDTDSKVKTYIAMKNYYTTYLTNLSSSKIYITCLDADGKVIEKTLDSFYA